MSVLSDFNETGWVKISNLAEKNLIDFISGYCRNLSGIKGVSDEDVPNSVCVYGDFALENFAEHIKPRLELLCGKQLLRTYSYLREYGRGSRLKRHVDREACEVSVSMCVGSEVKYERNPLFIEGLNHGAVREVLTSVGESVVYMGCKCEHWREEFFEGKIRQLFMHYVYKDGEYAHLANDSRAERFVVE